jgi:hypothetical protein
MFKTLDFNPVGKEKRADAYAHLGCMGGCEKKQLYFISLIDHPAGYCKEFFELLTAFQSGIIGKCKDRRKMPSPQKMHPDRG